MTAFKRPGAAIASLGAAASPGGRGGVLPASFGEAFGGGYICGTVMDGNTAYALIISPLAAETALQWKTTQTTTAGTDSRTNGPANTSAMANASHPAANYCAGLSSGGHSSWYLPAIDELMEAARHKDLLPVAGEFTVSASYWSSTEESSASAFRVEVGVSSGFPTEDTLVKDNALGKVRAFRRVRL